MRTKSLLLLLILAIPAVPSALAQISDTYLIPAAANAAGARGTRWASEVHIFNPQGHQLNIAVIFIPSGGRQASEAVVTADPNMTLYSENLLEDLFETADTGALAIVAFPEDNPHLPEDDVLAHSFVTGSRVYNNAAAGTFGQRIPGAIIALMNDGITAVADGIRNSASSGFRTNVGAVNVGRSNVRMKVQVYHPDGSAAGGPMNFDLPPDGHIQDALPVTVDHGSAEFWIDDDPSGESLVFPYASVVDNRSGDAVYVSPVLLAFPSELAPLSAGGSKAAPELRRISADDLRTIRAGAEKKGAFRLVDGSRLVNITE